MPGNEKSAADVAAIKCWVVRAVRKLAKVPLSGWGAWMTLRMTCSLRSPCHCMFSHGWWRRTETCLFGKRSAYGLTLGLKPQGVREWRCSWIRAIFGVRSRSGRPMEWRGTLWSGARRACQFPRLAMAPAGLLVSIRHRMLPVEGGLVTVIRSRPSRRPAMAARWGRAAAVAAWYRSASGGRAPDAG